MHIPTFSLLSNALFSGILLGGLFAVAALGLSLVFGVMRLLNLVHGELIVFAGYLSLIIIRHTHLDPLLTIFIVAPAMFLIGIPVYRLFLEPLKSKGAEPAMLTTFGLSVIAQSLFILFWSGDTQSLPASYATRSIKILGYRAPVMYLISFAISLVLFGAIQMLIQHTGLGREIRASSEDPSAAAAIGVNVKRVHTFVYALAAACAAIAGVLIGTTLDFAPSTGMTYLLSGFAVVVLGGLGSVKGTFFGAITLGIIESVGGAFFGDGYRTFVGFIAFLIVLSVRPQGIFGRAAKV